MLTNQTLTKFRSRGAPEPAFNGWLFSADEPSVILFRTDAAEPVEWVEVGLQELSGRVDLLARLTPEARQRLLAEVAQTLSKEAA